MYIRDFDIHTESGLARAAARVTWEERDLPRMTVFLEVPAAQADGLWCDPNALLLAAFLPAWRARERRIRIDAPVCPALRENLRGAVGTLETRHPELGAAPILDCPGGAVRPPVGRHAVSLLSCGLDSLAILRWNKLHVPADHPAAIKACLLLAFKPTPSASADEFEQRVQERLEPVHAVAADAGVDAIPAVSNLYGERWHGAPLAAAATLLSRRFARAYVASGPISGRVSSQGPHPWMDPYYSCARFQVENHGTGMTHLQRTALVANWPTGLQNLRVCREGDPRVNCGACERCIRTMAALVSLGKLRGCAAFPVDDVSRELLDAVDAGPRLHTDLLIAYREMLPGMTRRGRDDLAAALRRILQGHAEGDGPPAAGPLPPRSPAAEPARRDGWSPTSWRSRRALQQPEYPSAAALEGVQRQLGRLPPLVTSGEIEALRGQLAEAARGDRFLLQGGDCAEQFAECDATTIASKLKILLQMSLVLVHGAKKRVIRVGRFAGQYAKPRSEQSETRDGVTLPAYRGDLINGVAFEPAARTPDPERLLRGYERAALTLNFIRALIDGGFADLHHPGHWDLGWVRHSPFAAEYQRMVESIGESLRFMETLSGERVGETHRVDFFTSHEGLHLLYEQAQTRQVPQRGGWYNLSTHMPWIGLRTSQLGGAHVEYFRGIANPIAVKIGPGTTPEGLLELAAVLDPGDTPGRLTLIHRFGARDIARGLPPLLHAVEQAGRRVLWVCDPMHGNIERTPEGFKTRRFEHIRAELEQAFDIHQRAGTYLGGVHVELTGENVTECTGGARNLCEEDLARAYRSFVDPRLNYEQALELAMLIAHRMRH